MEANRDAAERCVELANAAAAVGDADRAIPLWRKSLALFPIPGVEKKIEDLMRAPPLQP